jgi:SpoIID/LytB domain protein
VRIGVLRGSSYDVITIPLEEYVARVLTGEALPGSPPAAMDALAIAVRTYTQANLGRHRADGFDLCDQTHCQVMRTASPPAERAAQATLGQVLLYQNAPATIYYSASCGGQTEIPSAVWPGADDPAYLPSRPDPGCGGDPLWTSELALSDLQRSFAAAGFRGTLRNLSIASRNSSGRVGKLTLDGLTPSEISGQDLRATVGRAMGWQYIRSASFDLRRVGNAFRMDGRGYGHGVGMCVIGSARLAEAGESAASILDRYYPGLTIGRFTPRPTTTSLAPSPTPSVTPSVAPSAPLLAVARAAASSPTPANAGGVSVALPPGDERETNTVLALAADARDSLSASLGVPPPARMALRVHGTSAEYERATGKAWYTFGAVVSAEIHLLPLASLRDRGMLERTINREVVRLLTEDALSRRPEWVRVGASLYFADRAQMSANLARSSCPTDADLLQPASVGALMNAYAEAQTCFARQIASGRSWRDVR